MFLWNDYQESLDKKYDMFRVNMQYKATSFKTEADYVVAQEALAKDIDKLNDEIFEKVRDVINEAYPDVEVIKYDSMTNSAAKLLLGRVLVDGDVDDMKAMEIEAWFLRKTAHSIRVDPMSSMPEEVKKFYSRETKR